MYKVITREEYKDLVRAAGFNKSHIRKTETRLVKIANEVVTKINAFDRPVEDPRHTDEVLFVKSGMLYSLFIYHYHYTDKSLVLDYSDGTHNVIRNDRIVALIRKGE